ncbi:hypothetical protein CHARACLAT_025581 [Characodon lateralis]|uniref:Interferon regulatory factor-3 domain-containing protein n=1 Tax=Characodon lateralis TaxID=208331 RepID=A0ABU7F611_9TELE|nr:hypothetical protein [Characodon lateralis]
MKCPDLPPSVCSGMLIPETKIKEKSSKKLKRRSSDSDSNITRVKQIKTEEVTSQLMKPEDEGLLQDNEPVQSDGPSQCTTVDEIRLDVRIEETVTTNTEDGDSFSVAVHYLGQEVLKRQICGPDVRIMYMPSSSMPPTPAGLNVRFPRILLPEPPPTLPAGGELQALFTLLPFMEKGIVLTSTLQGVYGRRFCQGRIFWTGPHTTTPGLHRMERNMEPVLLFSKDIFKQQLDHFQANGGERPKCSFTLCFGEEFRNTEDPSQKLIIAQISLPWAEQQVENVLSIFNTISVFQTLASQSPLGEITLNLITVPSQSSDLAVCPSP